jgi:hypothetical protein
MSDEKLFVIGAGASAEVGMPLGKGLKAQIETALTFEFAHGSSLPQKGSRSIVNELQRMQKEGLVNRNQFELCFREAEAASKGLALADSIDSYLDLHRDNKEIVLLGKMAIVDAILEAEETAYKRIFNSTHFEFNSRNLVETWYAKLLKHLSRGTSKEKIEDIFKNVTFIIFNYDRAVELFFPLLIKELCNVDLDSAISSFDKATIIHPYGKVGSLLPPSNGLSRGFGKRSRHLSEYAAEINTFTEGEQDVELAKSIDDAVAKASTIVFLGYGFIEMNNSLLMRTPNKKVERIFGTTKGLSNSDLASISKRIAVGFEKPKSAVKIGAFSEIEVSDMAETTPLFLTDKSCTEFFDEYRLTL